MAVNPVSYDTQFIAKNIANNENPDKDNESLFNNDAHQLDAVNIKDSKEQQNEVSFKEGVDLIGKGFLNKIKSIGKTIIEHPIKTVATVGVTMGAIAALPLIGISSAVGASALVIGFGAYAVGKTVCDVVETVSDNKNGRYDEVRQDLQQIGGDGVDLAMSLPFMPKAVKTLQRSANCAPAIGLNEELISNIKKSNSISDLQMSFAKANTLIEYETITNEMGLAAKPELVFSDLPNTTGGFYEPAGGKIYFNENSLRSQFLQCCKHSYNRILNKDEIEFINTLSSVVPEGVLRHELQHYQQFSDIAGVKGTDTLKNIVADYYKNLLEKQGYSTTQGIDTVQTSALADLDACAQGHKSSVDTIIDELSKDVVDNMANGDMSMFNNELYQNMADSNSQIYTDCDFQKVDSYLKALREKIEGPSQEVVDKIYKKYGIKDSNEISEVNIGSLFKAKQEIYKSNILEKEAYMVQQQFANDVIANRPDTKINAIEQFAIIQQEDN